MKTILTGMKFLVIIASGVALIFGCLFLFTDVLKPKPLTPVEAITQNIKDHVGDWVQTEVKPYVDSINDKPFYAITGYYPLPKQILENKKCGIKMELMEHKIG